jgi:hypothetical protein
MRFFSAALVLAVVVVSSLSPGMGGDASASSKTAPEIFGFRDTTAETAAEARFLAVPDPKSICAR